MIKWAYYDRKENSFYQVGIFCTPSRPDGGRTDGAGRRGSPPRKRRVLAKPKISTWDGAESEPLRSDLTTGQERARSGNRPNYTKCCIFVLAGGEQRTVRTAAVRRRGEPAAALPDRTKTIYFVSPPSGSECDRERGGDNWGCCRPRVVDPVTQRGKMNCC